MNEHINQCDAYKENSIFYNVFRDNPIKKFDIQELSNLKNELFIYIELLDKEIYSRSNNVIKDKS